MTDILVVGDATWGIARQARLEEVSRSPEQRLTLGLIHIFPELVASISTALRLPGSTPDTWSVRVDHDRFGSVAMNARGLLVTITPSFTVTLPDFLRLLALRIAEYEVEAYGQKALPRIEVLVRSVSVQGIVIRSDGRVGQVW